MPKFLRSPFRFLLLFSCFAFQAAPAGQQATSLTAANPQESFDTGTKADYAAGSVAFATGTWTLTDAVLGNAEADRKNGAQAVRLQQNGKLTMEFFVPNGAATVAVQHAIYGSDASSSWELWAQPESCNCNKWTKVGNTVFTTTSTLQAAAFTVNIAGNVKFEIRKTSGGASRLNIDDFAVTDFGVAQPSIDNDNMALGNPSGAITDVGSPKNYLMVKPQFTLSYNRDEGKPNWVSWHIDASDRGDANRIDLFRPDPTLPEGWYQVQANSYTSSGFDRGHNCPSADRLANAEDNAATFFMTNMMPQAPLNNQGPWADLENYARTFLPGNEVYVVCGSYGLGGTGANGSVTTTIDNGRITVPNRTWKVIVILPVGDNDAARVTSSTRVIAVDMPNTNSIIRDWGLYRTSVDAIETSTGYDLLSALPVDVQTAIESKVDAGPAPAN
ncbi:DNA/RNA non-specific endonuclease [Hymenobacter roseosalivarius DSM 11622]|uniref:DNA/RNA non-specific endonuclease n=1 Tax=Hymenobacter roseosalivarius DSM 11622 TaxID=645990 RepID=A0A1W1UTT4_9BACT|nr:DNA/RNA non-specific endonuclease [Hymenobacter roseosalivarius]SMB84211.1 DNA/RNA non-specific endonuclease [Hymenobacter roseosalivarius DSM 11622]